MVSTSLIPVHPNVEFHLTCVKCGSHDSSVTGLLYTGIRIVADSTCKSCGTRYYETLPVSHEAIGCTIAVSHDRQHERYDKRTQKWIMDFMIPILFSETHKVQKNVTKKSLRELKQSVIILNCLDDCFGHSLAKMINATALMEKYPDDSLVLMITPNLEWLVPDGVSELWIVEAKMSEMRMNISTLQGFVESQLKNIDRAYLSEANVYHELDKVNMKPLLRKDHFDFNEFKTKPFQITFPLRQDRFWHSNGFDQFMNLVFIKFRLIRYFRWYFIMKQNRRFQKTISLIRRSEPGVTFNITGLGEPGGFDGYVKDLRTTSPTPDNEKQWCDVYSRSHIIIGVHGSNMMIPTALAASFIELLPKYKVPFKGEDTFNRHKSRGRLYQLLGQHLELFVSPETVANEAINILRH